TESPHLVGDGVCLVQTGPHVDDDVAAVFGQRKTDLTTDVSAAASYQGDLAFERASHAAPPPSGLNWATHSMVVSPQHGTPGWNGAPRCVYLATLPGCLGGEEGHRCPNHGSRVPSRPWLPASWRTESSMQTLSGPPVRSSDGSTGWMGG